MAQKLTMVFVDYCTYLFFSTNSV